MLSPAFSAVPSSEGALLARCDAALQACTAELQALRGEVRRAASHREKASTRLAAAHEAVTQLGEAQYSPAVDAAAARGLLGLCHRAAAALDAADAVVRALCQLGAVPKMLGSLCGAPPAARFEPVVAEFRQIAEQARAGVWAEEWEPSPPAGGVVWCGVWAWRPPPLSAADTLAHTPTQLPACLQANMLAVLGSAGLPGASPHGSGGTAKGSGATVPSTDGGSTPQGYGLAAPVARQGTGLLGAHGSGSAGRSYIVDGRAVPAEAMQPRRLLRGTRRLEVTAMAYVPPDDSLHDGSQGRLWWATRK